MALTAAASLKLDKVLDLTIRALALRLAPLRMFSHVFQAGEVSRDKKIQVPCVPLEAMASKDFDYDVGYEDGNFNVATQEVQVAYRKYQSMTFTRDELIGLPIDVLAESMAQKADKLAADVITHIMSVITAANFGAEILNVAPGAFDSDQVADLDTALTNLLWPSTGRNLIVDTTYGNTLKKDPALKNAAASGSTATLREGTIGRVCSFDTYEVPGFPTNGEALTGIAALQYGILVASAPVMPTEEVKSMLSDYRLVTDEKTGLTLTYRAWGNPDHDNAKRVVEVGYGFAKGDAQQIKRIIND